MNQVAIIGGTGLETLPAECQFAVRFLSRHGADHSIAPHEIDYRANIAALAQLGVSRVFATNAVGSLRRDLPPGSLVLLDDFIDFTRQRQLTYWTEQPNRPKGVIHTDFSVPYCPQLRAHLLATADRLCLALVPNGTYVCADGPRFESPAEIRMFAQAGGDVVGMTGLPEAIFAREAGLCYAAIGIVTNYGAGLTESPVAHEKVLEQMAESAGIVRDLLMEAVKAIPESRTCGCSTALHR